MAATNIHLKFQMAESVIDQQPQMLYSETHHPIHEAAALSTWRLLLPKTECGQYILRDSECILQASGFQRDL